MSFASNASDNLLLIKLCDADFLHLQPNKCNTDSASIAEVTLVNAKRRYLLSISAGRLLINTTRREQFNHAHITCG